MSGGHAHVSAGPVQQSRCIRAAQPFPTPTPAVAEQTPYFFTSMRNWLLGLVLASLLPLALFATHLLVALGEQSQRATKDNLVQQTELVARALNERLSRAVGALTALAQDESFLTGDLERAYQQSHRLVTDNPEFRAVVLIGRDESMAFFTARPFGAALPAVSDVPALHEVFSSGRPVLSNVFKAPVSDRHVVAIGVPVRINGEVAYCLRLVLLADTLAQTVRDQDLPEDWIATTLDGSGTVVTRTLGSEQFVGKTASTVLAAASRENRRSIFKRVTSEGIPVTTAVRPVGNWGWDVAVSVPDGTLYGPLHDSLAKFAVIGMVSLGLALSFALWISRSLTRQFTVVARPGSTPQRLRVAELQSIQHHLASAEQERRRSDEALDTLSEDYRAAEAELLQARRDSLTRLYRREAFAAAYMQLQQHLPDSDRIALMFIDLDNFKAINDLQGHWRGDEVLREVAGVIGQSLRGSDLAGRLGGDEFVVALVAPADQIEAIAATLAERLIEAIQAINAGLGASIGIVIASGDSTLPALQRLADGAMYRAKHAGKGRYCLVKYSATDDTPSSGSTA